MPISLPSPQSLTVSQAKITRFEVNVDDNSVTVYFDKGLENNGVWVTVESSSHTFKDLSFPTDIYSSVKDYLYNILNSIL